jgi:hypothetical protein
VIVQVQINQPPIKIGITKRTSRVPLLDSLWFALNPRGKGSVLTLPTVYCSSSLYPLILACSLHSFLQQLSPSFTALTLLRTVITDAIHSMRYRSHQEDTIHTFFIRKYLYIGMYCQTEIAKDEHHENDSLSHPLQNSPESIVLDHLNTSGSGSPTW